MNMEDDDKGLAALTAKWRDEQTRARSEQAKLLCDIAGTSTVAEATGVFAAWKTEREAWTEQAGGMTPRQAVDEIARFRAEERAGIVRGILYNRKATKVQSEQDWFTAMTNEQLKAYAASAPSHAPIHVPDSAVGEEPIDPELNAELRRQGLTAKDYHAAMRYEKERSGDR